MATNGKKRGGPWLKPHPKINETSMNNASQPLRKLTTEEMGRLSVEEYRAAEKLPLVLVLDNVRSQNNVGSLFRTGDAFRVARICLCGITSTPPHRDIHKTALGAEDAVEWSHFDETADCLRALKADGYTVFAVEQAEHSTILNDFVAPAGAVALVFGNEVEGVQASLLPLCDGCIEIPQFGTKHSLNVSCAAAVVMWEVQKQMRDRT